jgi:protein arginine N-methyltransferase 1
MNVVRTGDVVVDIGCGTGILTLFACMAGAGHVYAFEQDPIIDLARQVCEQNGFASRITFINEWSTRSELPQRADVLVSETIGNLGFDEGIAGWIDDARKRLLKPEARIVPASLSLIAAPIDSENAYDSVAGWDSDPYTLRFDAARRAAANTIWWADLPAESILARPFSFWQHDLYQDQASILENEHLFELGRDGTAHGIGLWFSAELAPGISLSSAPPNRVPSWQHGFLPLERPLTVQEGGQLRVALAMGSNGGQWEWRVTPFEGKNRQTADQQIGRAGLPARLSWQETEWKGEQ